MRHPFEIPVMAGPLLSLNALVVGGAVRHHAAKRLHAATWWGVESVPTPVSAVTGYVALGAFVFGAVHLLRRARRQQRTLREREGIDVADTEPPAQPYRSVAPARRELPLAVRRELLMQWVAVGVPWVTFAAVGLRALPRCGPWTSGLLVASTAYLALMGGVLLRYRRLEAFWSPWMLGACAALLALTGDPRVSLVPLIVGAHSHWYVLAEERRGSLPPPS